MVYRVSSHTARATEKPCLENQEKKSVNLICVGTELCWDSMSPTDFPPHFFGGGNKKDPFN